MLLIAIDGACRRNGKPDCVSAGGVLIIHHMQDGNVRFSTRHTPDFKSTNQRGELKALHEALKEVRSKHEDACIITDSEYLFNAMNKEWLSKWAANNWTLSSGEPVKNADLWKDIYNVLVDIQTDVAYYHIKGHCIPFGAVTAHNLLESDPSGRALYKAILVKYDVVQESKKDNLAAANNLSVRNNGFELSPETLRSWVALNTAADAVATEAVNIADSSIRKVGLGRS